MKQPILAKRDTLSAANRARFEKEGVFVLNILAGPGSGKTSTILALIEALRDEFNIAVIDGDAASMVDSPKIEEQGIAAVQVNTDGACHLDSAMVSRALDVLDLSNLDLILLENVGTLGCLADSDLGENAKVTIVSVSEGDGRPLKHPGIFQESQAIVLNKVDTMPLFDFDEQAFRGAIRQLNPVAPIFPLSATTGQGVEGFAAWLTNQIHAVGKRQKER